jgi:hypothetical protein
MKDNKKSYRYPALTISVSKEDMQIAKELREKHYVNISAFVREKLKELYESYEGKRK